MLAAAVVGDVFASPPAEAILACLKAVTGAAGTLLVVMNYTGGYMIAPCSTYTAEYRALQGLNVLQLMFECV